MTEPDVSIPPDAQPLHEHLRAHARRHPAKPAIVWYGQTVSYAELDAASDAFAARLAELGVRHGEPVALFLSNCPQYVMAHLGIQKLGAVVCPCGPLNKEHELQYQLADLQARVIVAAAPLLPTVDKVRADTALQHTVVVHYADWLPDAPALDLPAELAEARQAPRTVPPGCEDFRAIVRSGAPCPPATVGMTDLGLMTYTSGTTGLPKGAMLSHDNALFKAQTTSVANGLGPDDVMLAIAPMYHMAGKLIGLDYLLYSGCTMVLLHRFEPRAALQAIARHRVTWWYGMTPMNLACMALPDAKDFDLSSLRLNPVTSFGVTYTQAIAEQWRGYAPNCQGFEAAYGLSETHTCDTCMPRDAVRWGTHGRPSPGVAIRILDPETGAPRAAGESGEIVLKSRGSFLGYWNKPEATAKTLHDGWVHTGDIGVIDAEGYLTFSGRIKEMIKVSGYSVFPEEVESILVKHPGVAQAAVIAVHDPDKGEVVRAFIVRQPGAAGDALDEPGLIAWAREHMAVYKAPRSVRFIAALPATGAGKVLRRLLKDHP